MAMLGKLWQALFQAHKKSLDFAASNARGRVPWHKERNIAMIVRHIF